MDNILNGFERTRGTGMAEGASPRVSLETAPLAVPVAILNASHRLRQRAQSNARSGSAKNGDPQSDRTSRGSLRILQHNMQRSRTVTDEVRVCMDKHDADVLLMQEPCNSRGTLPGMGRSTAVILGDSTGLTVQAAVAIRTAGLTPVKISHLCNTHCVVVQIASGGVSGLYLVSQYFQYADDIEPYLEHLGKVLNELRGFWVIIAAHVNAKSNQCTMVQRYLKSGQK